VGGTSGNLSCAPGTSTLAGLYHPTFLYECLWDIAIGVALILIDRRLRLGRGNVMALYVMGYTAGRSWIEALRTDPANHLLGLRLNDWTSLFVFLGGLVWFVKHGGFHSGRDTSPYYANGPDEPTDNDATPQQQPAADRPAEAPPVGGGSA
jgi:hypothetical protein